MRAESVLPNAQRRQRRLGKLASITAAGRQSTSSLHYGFESIARGLRALDFKNLCTNFISAYLLDHLSNVLRCINNFNMYNFYFEPRPMIGPPHLTPQ